MGLCYSLGLCIHLFIFVSNYLFLGFEVRYEMLELRALIATTDAAIIDLIVSILQVKYACRMRF